MIKWGAVVDPNDRNAFIEYLSTKLPPEKATYPSERAGTEKRK
jgi:hypothetical protein